MEGEEEKKDRNMEYVTIQTDEGMSKDKGKTEKKQQQYTVVVCSKYIFCSLYHCLKITGISAHEEY